MNAASQVPTTDSPVSGSSAAAHPDLLKLETELVSLRRRLTWLTAAVFLVALALLLFVAGFLSGEIDYHYGEYKLIAGACTGGTVMGFLFGWLAARRAG
ncbi:MAG TPA: hypothetical protein VGJ04_08615 [Pirellulales bacterium]|jgi:hypothetical protein